MKINEEKVNEWRLLLNEHKQSGLSIKNFCKERNITPAIFYYYRDIIEKPNKQQIRIEKKEAVVPDIKPIQIINSPSKDNSPIRFIMPNSIQCILPRDMLPREIKSILEVLMSC